MAKKNSKKTVPELRFRGFTDPWEQRQLGEVGTTYSGLSGKTKEDFGHGDACFVTYMNVYSNAVANPDGIEAIEEDPRQHEVMNGDVFFTGSSETPDEVGLSSVWLWNTANTYLNSFCFGYRPCQEFDSLFLAASLRSPQMRSRISLLAQGISRFNISKKQVMQQPLNYPSLPEQRLIGRFFSTLDSLIAAAERQEALLRQKKQAYLQLMFPREGETRPRLRFSGFSGDWEQRQLGEVAEVIGGGTPDSSNPRYWDGDIDWYTPSEIGGHRYLDESVRKITHEGLNNSSAKLLPKGSILFTSRASIGLMAFIRRPSSTNQGFQSLVPSKLVDPDFLFAFGPFITRYAKTHAAGSTFIEISGKSLGKTPLALPTIPEQRLIGQFFKTLDSLIAAAEKRTKHLHALKGSYLQRMFA